VSDLKVSRHAIERYQERVKPGLSYDRAKVELEVLARSGKPGPEPPTWKLPSLIENDRTYLEPSDGICLVVKAGLVTTVAIRAEQAPEFARAKREQRRREKQKRRSRNNYGAFSKQRQMREWE
jgi:hypothetical protein